MRAQVTVKSSPLVTGETIPNDAWVALAQGAELVVHHDVSGREWLLSGPGEFLVCPSGSEQILVHRGKLHSSFGTGVRPGAEAWIFLPGGSARYGDAELELEVAPALWSLRLARGAADAEVWNAAAEPEKAELTARNPRFVHRGRADFSRLVAACVSAADKAEASAKSVLAANSHELGRLAAEQLRDRRTARGRCGAARAAADPQANANPATQALLDSLESADQRWQRIPKSP